jgi:hypothetical protein
MRFLHLQYHLQNMPYRTLQQLFNDTCLEAFTEAGVPVSRMTVAYQRSSNIADVSRRNRLDDATNTIPTKGLFLVLHERLCMPPVCKDTQQLDPKRLESPTQ